MKYIDMHCDTISRLHLCRKIGNDDNLRESRGHVDLVRMKKGGCLAQNFALFVNIRRQADPYGYCMALYDRFGEEISKNQDWIKQAVTVKEILEHEKCGEMSAVLTLEEGAVCLGKTEILRDFYKKGVRMMTLTWNHQNELASPNKMDPETGKTMPETEKGLTKKGIEFVELMEELGMIVDVSHLGDAGFWDVVRITKQPFVASHSNARAITPHARNLTDDMIKAISQKGGVIGINYYAAFLNEQEMFSGEENSRIQDMIRHICHIKKIGGIECIGLGSDFDGITGQLEIDSPASFYLLHDELKCQGFTEEEIEKIFYKNALRLYQDVWKE